MPRNFAKSGMRPDINPSSVEERPGARQPKKPDQQGAVMPGGKWGHAEDRAQMNRYPFQQHMGGIFQYQGQHGKIHGASPMAGSHREKVLDTVERPAARIPGPKGKAAWPER